MTLTRHGPTPLERRLLLAGRSERPSWLTRHRMALALGFWGTLFHVREARALLGSWAKLGALLVFVAGASSVALQSGREKPRWSPAEPRLARVVVAEALQRAPSPAEPAAKLQPVPQAAQRSSAARQTAPRGAVGPVQNQGTLAEEVRLLDAARSRIRESRPRDARKILEHYARAFPSGLLKHEAGLLLAQVSSSSVGPDRSLE